MVVLVGNHDIYYKNSLKVNSLNLLLGEYIASGHVTVIDYPKTMFFDDSENYIDMIPWICDENREETMDFITQSKSETCIGHFELKGFEMDRNHWCMDGMDKASLNRYRRVLSGHFHHPSTDGHITYLGSPGEITWADHGDTRGFYLYDITDGEMQFFENPYHMFYKVDYDDRHETFESVTQASYEKYRRSYVKIVVIEKTNPLLFEKFMEKIYEVDPIELIVTDAVQDIVVVDEASDTTVDFESTIDLIEHYVDILDMDLDKPRLKGTMRQIYNDAHQSEVIEE